MKIAYDYPPNYPDIIKTFPEVSRMTTVVFTYGDTLHIPSGATPSKALLEHEEMHTRQQTLEGGPEAWWKKYLEDPEFRFNQELQAYQRQYKYMRANEPRPQHRHNLRQLARDLASPIYGSIVSKQLAKDMIAAQ